MARHTVRLELDDEIPEHRAILERIQGMSGLARSEFLRLHLFRAVADVERVLRAATKQVERLQLGITARRERSSTKSRPKKPRGIAEPGAATSSPSDVPPVRPPLQPFTTR